MPSVIPLTTACLERVAAALEPILARAAPDPLPLPTEWRKIGVAKRLRDTSRLLEVYQAISGLGADLPEAMELLVGAARPILERWFESEVLRATLATDARHRRLCLAVVSRHRLCPAAPRHGRSRRCAGRVGLRSRGHGRPRLGTGRLLHRPGRSTSAANRRSNGFSIHNGQVAGVALWDDTLLEAPVVASSIDAHQTFERLLDPAELPAEFRQGSRQDRLFLGLGQDQPGPVRAAEFHLPARPWHWAAPSRHHPHQPHARLHGAGLRRRQVRLAQH